MVVADITNVKKDGFHKRNPHNYFFNDLVTYFEVPSLRAIDGSRLEQLLRLSNHWGLISSCFQSPLLHSHLLPNVVK